MKHKPTKYEDRSKKKGTIYDKKREKFRASIRKAVKEWEENQSLSTNY